MADYVYTERLVALLIGGAVLAVVLLRLGFP